jgi:hypothetical protein
MTVKKIYNVGDTVWIYGVNRSNVKPTQGKVVKVVTIDNYSDNHYIIEIPTHIEPLLEIRTWHNISQDEKGPVGSLRTLGNIEPTIKFAGTVGFAFDDNPELDTDDDEISPEQIHAALEKSQKDVSHAPLNLKSEKPAKRRHYRKKTKSE